MIQQQNHRKDPVNTIFQTALKAVDPFRALHNYISVSQSTLSIAGCNCQWNLSIYEHVYVVGCGKAVVPMALAIEELLGEYISGGRITTKYHHIGHIAPRTIQVDEAGHPEPDQAGMKSCEKIINLLHSTTGNDLVIALISGGGSALWPQPPEGISLQEKVQLSQALLESGAPIHEMNTVRKHCSVIKGGWGATYARPSHVVAFVISDVIGDDLDVIASGPFVPDDSSFNSAQQVLQSYNLISKLPSSVVRYIEKGVAGQVPETPKPSDPVAEDIVHSIVSSNQIALNKAMEQAQALGFNVVCLDQPMKGEAAGAAEFFVNEALKYAGNAKRPLCVLAGGETTVTLTTNSGVGGRNQEFALAAAHIIKDKTSIVIASCATDGNDGPTDAAGAIADGSTIQRAEELGLDPAKALREHNAYPFFRELGDLLKTGPTITNVADLQIAFLFD